MRSRLAAFVATLAALICFASPAAAQEGASVVILKFELLDVPESTRAAFDSALTDAINAAPDMYVKTAGEVNMKDLLLAVGCESPSADCLGGLAEFVDGDRIVFGSVQRSEDVTLFTVRMFDFAESRFIRETVDQTVQGDEAKVKEAIPAIVEGFVYGDTGVLTVNVAGADNAEIFVDGEKVGVAPMTLENLALGERAVSVKTRDGEEQTEKIILRNGQAETVEFAFGSGDMADNGGGEEASGASTVPGWVSIGIGLAGAGLGVYGMLQESSVESDLEARCADGNSFGNVCSGDNAALGSSAEAAEIQGLIDDGGTARTLQLAGFSVAAVGLVVGGILLYTAYSSDGGETDTAAAANDDSDDPAVSNVTFGIAPTPDGLSAGFGFSF
jgi:hypothetical protein